MAAKNRKPARESYLERINRQRPANIFSRLTGHTMFSPIDTIKHLRIRETMTMLSHVLGGSGRIKVFEIGAYSGRLASIMLSKFKLEPSKYVIGDLDYVRGDFSQGPRLVRKVHSSVAKGKMKKVLVDLMHEPPRNIGKFNFGS